MAVVMVVGVETAESHDGVDFLFVQAEDGIRDYKVTGVQTCALPIYAQVFKEARRPAYVLQVDFGPALGLRKSSAQITALYRPEELIGRQVVAVLNFPSKQIGPMRSECLVTGFHNEKARWRCACPTARCRWVPSCCDEI